MAKKNIQEEKQTAEEKLIGSVSGFFQKNKILVIVIIAVLVVGIIAAIVALNISANAKDKAQLHIAELENRYAEILGSEEPDWTDLVADLKANIKGATYPSVKAAYILGLVYYQQDDYANAQSAFEQVYSLNKDIYLAAEALANAAACADAQGNTSMALELYNQIYSDYPESGTAPKALFNVARIYYQMDNIQLAQATFAQVADYYPNSEYGMLAQNLASVL